MSHINPFLNAELAGYINQLLPKQSDALKKLQIETDQLPAARMRIAEEQAACLQWLIQLTQSKTILEIGMFTGYSALAMAFALPETGMLTTCDISDEHLPLAKKHWEQAGVLQKITPCIGPALETLKQLKETNHQFDFIFIDADKPNYLHYYEYALDLLSPNGVIALDNMLWSGFWVHDTSNTSHSAKALYELNAFIANDPRVRPIVLPVGGGMVLVQKNVNNPLYFHKK